MARAFAVAARVDLEAGVLKLEAGDGDATLKGWRYTLPDVRLI
jgi:hypothetical protein